MLKIVETAVEGKLPATLDDLVREGARRMLMEALEAEVSEYVERHRAERGEDGRALVVRNGHARARQVTTGAGTVGVQAPRVDDRRSGHRFTSSILPPYMRRSPNGEEVLPVLYLRGLSTGDFKDALGALLGEEASGLSPSSIARMTAAWEEEYRSFRQRDLSEKDYVYVWADGVHFRVRLEEDRLCTLVLLGVRSDGTKELVAVEDGYRESAESWSSVLRDLKRRGLRAPVLAVGDGALGLWRAVRDVWPETREQRCWVHRLRNVLDKLPNRPRSLPNHGHVQAHFRIGLRSRTSFSGNGLAGPLSPPVGACLLHAPVLLSARACPCPASADRGVYLDRHRGCVGHCRHQPLRRPGHSSPDQSGCHLRG